MKITLAIVFVFFTLIFLSACSFKAKEANELENLARNYGGIYIFDKEILEKEKAYLKALKDESLGHNMWDRMQAAKKNFSKSFLMVVSIIMVIIIMM